MRAKEFISETVSGAIATVAQPMGMLQTRTQPATATKYKINNRKKSKNVNR